LEDLVDATLAARALATARIALGLGLFLAPRRLTRIWLGDEADGRFVPAVVRGVGARDVALGVGTLVALGGNEPTREADRWLEAAIVGDLGDAVGTLLTGRLDRDRAVIVAIAGGAAVAGAVTRAWTR
jgi:hypothetical protein